MRYYRPQVILGLICPLYITQLEFKSREELQLMPQTQEEHLIALEDENEDSEPEQGPPGQDVEVIIFALPFLNFLQVVNINF